MRPPLSCSRALVWRINLYHRPFLPTPPTWDVLFWMRYTSQMCYLDIVNNRLFCFQNFQYFLLAAFWWTSKPIASASLSPILNKKSLTPIFLCSHSSALRYILAFPYINVCSCDVDAAIFASGRSSDCGGSTPAASHREEVASLGKMYVAKLVSTSTYGLLTFPALPFRS